MAKIYRWAIDFESISRDLKMYGYAYDNVGFYFNLIDNRETGLNVDYSRINDNTLDDFISFPG